MCECRHTNYRWDARLQSTSDCVLLWLYRCSFTYFGRNVRLISLALDAAGLASSLCRKQFEQSYRHNPKCNPFHAYQLLNPSKPPFGFHVPGVVTCHLSAQQWPQCGVQRWWQCHSCGQCAAAAINCLVEPATAATASSLL